MADGGGMEAGEQAHDAIQVLGLDVELEGDLVARGQGGLEHEGDLVDLGPLPGVLAGLGVGDEPGLGDQQLLDDAQAVGADGAAGLGDLDHGVHQALHHLGLGGAPGELHAGLDAALRQVALGEAQEFGGDLLALEVGDRVDRRVLGHHQHPAAGLLRALGVGEGADLLDLGLGLQDPVQAGQAQIQGAAGDVGRHLLGPHQDTGQIGVVHGGVIVAIVGADLPAGLFEEGQGGLFEAALGQAEAKRRHDGIDFRVKRRRRAGRAILPPKTPC